LWQGSIVLGHLGINVPDLSVARAYYDEMMPLLGFEPYFSLEDQFAYKPVRGRPGTYLFVYAATEPGSYSRHRTGLQHLAFMVRSRSLVRAVHDRAVELGSEIDHPPREFPEYPPPHYFATFWFDPFGFLFEAVCHHDRD
jgi:catechol 2,3-dioxygenase-like lactoylglutathione lyase family enzyme